ncbi:MAG: error-prone DNA polymerase [Wenzhouxiangella sp.]
MIDYAELHALSAFSFRRACSEPGVLVRRAAELGYRALAITDECSLAGVVRAHEAAREVGLPLIVGSECRFGPALVLVLLAPSQAAYSQLSRLITLARRRADKGQYRLALEDLDELGDELLAIWKPQRPVEMTDDWLLDQNRQAEALKTRFPGRLWLGATRLLQAGEVEWFGQLENLGRYHGLPRLACGDVRMARRSERALLDVLNSLDIGRPLAECGLALAANGERHLRTIDSLEALYPEHWLTATVDLAARCRFSMTELGYRYPKELVPEPLSPIQHLRQLTLEGLHQRYGPAPPESVRSLVSRELALIEDMGVEAFFLTVHDLVCFARSRGILCQGRGSAANSAVCYCLGITEVDPSKQQLLFERFLSRERNEPPDIDVDFEHERREEVLQYVYRKYGRERAALAATVICYRAKSAIKDVGRALGLAADQVNRLTASLAGWDQAEGWPERLREAGFDPDSPVIRQLSILSQQLIGLPRHLSQHVGGMVISDQPLHHLVPVENAAMAERTIIQWDKDDLETLGLLKVDCLALGMLTVIRKTMALINRGPGSEPLSLATLPREDPATYDMLCRGDAVGVFQVESRAQMAMLPRLKPRRFYDLVVEVAIVRPGPIQGEMVHPYLERRDHPERVSYPSPELKTVLERTLGVPIFQEQVMQIAMVAAGFSPGEADQLRRAMAAWKRRGGLEPFREKLHRGMLERGYSEDFAERIYSQIQGFGNYGFPESHAASFALLTYFSAWLKCHHPAEFACALINSQPMGFYAPAQIINDVKRHGVRVLPVDIRFSDWDCFVVEQPPQGHGPGLRLGLRLVKGFDEAAAGRIVAARDQAPFRDVQDLAERAALNSRQLRALADANALKALAGHRNRARWQALGARAQGDLLAGAPMQEARVTLRPPSRRDTLLDDYGHLGLSLDEHPARLLRRALPAGLARRLSRASELAALADGRTIEVVGLVTHRQRPGTASGVIFLSLEDETGIINVIVWPQLAERFRREVLGGSLLRVRGQLQNANGTQHLVARQITSEAHRLDNLSASSRDFC